MPSASSNSNEVRLVPDDRHEQAPYVDHAAAQLGRARRLEQPTRDALRRQALKERRPVRRLATLVSARSYLEVGG